jgi:hypothetical protein
MKLLVNTPWHDCEHWFGHPYSNTVKYIWLAFTCNVTVRVVWIWPIWKGKSNLYGLKETSLDFNFPLRSSRRRMFYEVDFMLCHSSSEWLENDQWYWRHSAWYAMKLNSPDLSIEYNLVTQLKLWYINKSDEPQKKICAKYRNKHLFYVFCTVYFDTVIQHKPPTCILSKLMF